MNKTIDANIGGLHFDLEEAAYARLGAYLEAIKLRLAGRSYADEVLADIELRAAEQFQKKGRDRVITPADVEQLISELGTADELAGTDAGPSEEKTDKTDDRKRTRRLYRNPDDMIVAGVASGLAAYFGVDPTWVRVAFVLATLLGASGVLVYLLLWLIVPLAETPAEKLEMRGDAVTLEKMEQLVKERLAETKADEAIRRTGAAARDAAHAASGFARDMAQRASSPLRRLLSGLLTLVCIVVVTGAAFGAVILTVGAAFVVFSGAPISPAQAALGPLAFTTLLGLAYLACLLPLVVVMVVAGAAARRSLSATGPAILALGIIWALTLAGGSALIGGNLNAIRASYAEASAEIVEPLQVSQPFTAVEVSNDIAVIIEPGFEDSRSAAFTGTSRDFSSLTYDVWPDGRLVIGRREERLPPCIGCAHGRPTVRIAMPSIASARTVDISRLTITGFDLPALALEAQDASRLTFYGTAGTLSANAKDASRIELSGVASTMTLQSHDISRIEASRLLSEKAALASHDASSIIIGLTNDLDARSSDISKIRYAGSPTVVNASPADASSIRQINE